MCRQILRGVADIAIELSDYLAGVEQWKEWEEEVIEVRSSTRSEKEERRLWIMLEESDREQANELERKSKKAARQVSTARTRMGAGQCQPGGELIPRSVRMSGGQ